MSSIQPHVKICGIRPGDDLSFTAHQRVTHIGFIFVEASKRYVAPSSVRAICDGLARDCEAVGVFADADCAEVLTVAEQSGIDVAQLHGSETTEMCQSLRGSGLKVWKSLQIPETGVDTAVIRRQIEAYLPVTDAILLDAKPPADAQVSGGHGRAFDWRALSEIAPLFAESNWWVAGGITPDNVQNLLAVCHPDGIDVSSGVEAAGRKQPKLIQELLEAVDKA